MSSSTNTGITFAVDDVELGPPHNEAVRMSCSWEELIERELGEVMLMDVPRFLPVRTGSVNPLVDATWCAYGEHWPLVLSPDVIWLTIAQGFAAHVSANQERLRPRLVRHDGKLELEVRIAELNQETVASCVDDWVSGIADHTGVGMKRLLLSDFSTTTTTSRVASGVAMMDTFEDYFDYTMVRVICGIPTITLKGTVEDWETIRERVAVLGEFELQWWTDRLEPILDALVATARGEVPQRFWQNILRYNPGNIVPRCGPPGLMSRWLERPDRLTGWLAELFPYVGLGSGLRRNPAFEKRWGFLSPRRGIDVGLVPSGRSQVPVTYRTLDPSGGSYGEDVELMLHAGLVGVHGEPETRALEPVIGWWLNEPAQGFRL